MSLLMDDLRNRQVVRVAVAYVLTVVGIMIGMGVIEAAVGLPDWAVRMVAGAAFFGMPFLLVLVWALNDNGPENPRARNRVAAPLGALATIRTDRTP